MAERILSMIDKDGNATIALNRPGKTLTKEIGVPLSDLEETVAEIDVIDPDGLADYLLG